MFPPFTPPPVNASEHMYRLDVFILIINMSVRSQLYTHIHTYILWQLTGRLSLLIQNTRNVAIGSRFMNSLWLSYIYCIQDIQCSMTELYNNIMKQIYKHLYHIFHICIVQYILSFVQRTLLGLFWIKLLKKNLYRRSKLRHPDNKMFFNIFSWLL